MALSPYRDDSSPGFRSRSSSLSQASRNFMYQEVLEIDGNTLVRSCSCGQVFTKDENGQTIQTTLVRISNFISPGKRLTNLNTEINGKSLSVPNKLRDKTRDWKTSSKAKRLLQFPEKAKLLEPVAYNESNSKQKVHKSWITVKISLYYYICLFTILSGYLIHIYDPCNQSWDTQKIINKLKDAVYGQDIAVAKIEHILTKFHDSDDSAVLCFTGCTGVGKTFVSSIIYENFPWISNQYVNFYGNKTEKILSNKVYKSCGVNLLVIDGVHTSVADSLLRTVSSIVDNNSSAKFFIILICKTLDDEERNLVLKSLEGRGRIFHHISFQDLKRKEIQKCFNAELKRQKKLITDAKLEQLVDGQMKFCNISKSFPGCKNVYHEVSRL